MSELQRKKQNRKIIYSIPSLIVLSIIAFFLARGSIRVMEKEYESRMSSKNLDDRASALVLREQDLKENLARLKTDEGIKNEIRERFNVTQEGEEVAIIVDERGVSSSSDDRALPWYKRFWSAIMTRINANKIE